MKVPSEIPFTHFERILESIDKISDSSIAVDLNREIDETFKDVPDQAKRFLYGHMSTLFMNVILNRTYLGKTALGRAEESRMIIKLKVDQLKD